MANQQAQIASTIRAMKAALKRKADDSEPDDEITSHTNRGHKLQRGAKNIRSGQLDTTGRLAWKKRTEHAGYTRYTIARNPPLYDMDGEPYDPQISDDEREAEPVEEDVFGSVQLEWLLRPLTSAAELPEHPSLSQAYRSRGLTEMCAEAEGMLRREENLLWKAKRLLRRLRGDVDWAPCEAFETEQDEGMLLGEEGPQEGYAANVGGGLEGMEVEKTIEGEQEQEGMDGVEAMDMALQKAAAEAEKNARKAEGEHTAEIAEQPPTTATNGETVKPLADQAEDPVQAEAEPENEANDTSDESSKNTGHAMTTRARARSPQASPSPDPSDSASIPEIHPWFLPPSSSLRDPNLGLPASEAEDTRRLLLLYTQKQEAVVRHLRSLYSSLAKADRLRKSVYNACRAEGHTKPAKPGGYAVDEGRGPNRVTEMSDGEDWVDTEALGLGRGDLKWIGGGWGLEKGKEEVEEEGEEGVAGRRGGRRRRGVRM